MPIPDLFPARSVRAALLVLALGTAMGGCSLLGLDKDDASNDLNKDAAQYQERPVEQIYGDAWAQISKNNWDEAAKQFNEVDRQHPYSVWARRAMLMSAFCSYQANKYGDAVATADQYISLHPGSHEVAYAFYLKAISLYEQIVDVNRDQANTQGALVALQDVVQRFPDTEYARDATLKIDLTQDHLAGKEMAVGRYYLTRGDYIGGINRFRVVMQQYQTDAPDRRSAGASDRGLLCAGPGQRGADRRRRAGRQLSRQPMVHGRLRHPEGPQSAPEGRQRLLDQPSFPPDTLRVVLRCLPR